MRPTVLLFVVLSSACGNRPVHDGAQEDGGASVAPTSSSPSMPEASNNGKPVDLTPPANEPAPANAPTQPDAGPVDGRRVDGGPTQPLMPDARPGYYTNIDKIDATCTSERVWIFPDQAHSSYCGSIADACKAICGTPIGCTVDPVAVGGGPVIQYTYCPKQRP